MYNQNDEKGRTGREECATPEQLSLMRCKEGQASPALCWSGVIGNLVGLFINMKRKYW